MAKKNNKRVEEKKLVYHPFLVRRVMDDGRRPIMSRHLTRTAASIHYVLMEDINPNLKFEIVDERKLAPDYVI